MELIKIGTYFCDIVEVFETSEVVIIRAGNIRILKIPDTTGIVCYRFVFTFVDEILEGCNSDDIGFKSGKVNAQGITQGFKIIHLCIDAEFLGKVSVFVKTRNQVLFHIDVYIEILIKEILAVNRIKSVIEKTTHIFGWQKDCKYTGTGQQQNGAQDTRDEPRDLDDTTAQAIALAAIGEGFSDDRQGTKPET